MSDMSLSDLVPTPPDRLARRTERAVAKRRKRKRRRAKLSLLLGVLLVSAAVFGAWFGIKPLIASFNEPDDWPGPGSGSVTVHVDPGMSGSAIAQELKDAGVVKTVGAFVSAVSANPDGGNVEPGTYRLKLQMTSAEALLLLLDPQSRQTITVSVPEGKRVDQIVAIVAKALKVDAAKVTAATTSPELGLPPAAQGRLEGMLFPATYTFEPGVTPVQVLHKMVARTTQAFDELGVPAAQLYPMLIKASLVQAEAGKPDDFGKIARVIDNRIAIHMPLGFDTTIHYITKRYTVGTTVKDTQIASLYNTYLHQGVPPGPICSPGEAAIKAVQTPAAGPWIYFVTTNPSTKETKFTASAAEFEKFKQEYNLWQKAHPGQ